MNLQLVLVLFLSDNNPTMRVDIISFALALLQVVGSSPLASTEPILSEQEVEAEEDDIVEYVSLRKPKHRMFGWWQVDFAFGSRDIFIFR